MTVLHRHDRRQAHEVLEGFARYGDMMQSGVLIKHDAQRGEHLGQFTDEPKRIRDGGGEVIGKSEQDAVGGRLADHLDFLDSLARIGRGDADENRHSARNHVDRLPRKDGKFIRQ